jgi:3-phenylpropionate/cinnamic acid dioxygenase small subunit
MSIEWLCSKLCYRFAYLLDAGDFEGMISLFTKDGVFDRVGEILHGHERMRHAFQARPKVTSRHCVTNIHFLDVQADQAEARVYNMSYHAIGILGDQPLVYATQNGRCIDFHDHYVLTQDGWRFASRKAQVVFVPSDWALPPAPSQA